MTGRTRGGAKSIPLATFVQVNGAAFLGAKGRLPELQATLARVASVEQATGARIHIVDAASVCGPAHLASALLHARRAHERQRGEARDLKVELLMYLAGERQLNRAIEAAGLKPKTAAVGIAVEGTAKESADAAASLLDSLKLSRDDAVLAATAAKAKALGVSGEGKTASEWEGLALEVTGSLDVE